MPDPAPAPEAPQQFSEESFFALAAQMAEGTAPAPEAAPAPAVAAAPVQVIELEAAPGPGSALPPAPAAAPAPAASADLSAPAPAAPAPADPNALNPDAPRNYRIQAQDAIEQRTLQLRAQNRDLTLPAAMEQAYKELGLPAPFAPPAAAPAAPANPAAPEPATQAPTDPLAQIEADITAREQALADLNPALDAQEWNRINAELRKLERQAASIEAQQAAQAQFDQVNAQQTLQQIQTALHGEYNVLADASHPFTIAFEQRRAQVYQTGTDEQLADPNLELNLAREIEAQFQSRYGMAVRTAPLSSPAAQPQAPNAPVTQPPAPPAVAPVPAALPRSAAAPLSGAPASVSPVTGITPPNPLGQVQQTLQSAQQGLINADDFGDALLNAAYNGGQGAPAFDPFGIRMAA